MKNTGADPNAIMKDPRFKEANYLMSVNPEEARIRDNRKVLEDKYDEDFSKAGDNRLGTLDYKASIDSGQNQTLGQTYNQVKQTSLEGVPDYQERYTDISTRGTQKDLQNYYDDSLKNLTGDNSITTDTFRQDVNGKGRLLSKAMQSVGEHYGLDNVAIKNLSNQQQEENLGKYLAENLNSKAMDAMKANYYSKTRSAAEFDNLSDDMKMRYLNNYAQNNPKIKDPQQLESNLKRDMHNSFQQYANGQIDELLGMKSKNEKDIKEKFQSIGDYPKDALGRKALQEINKIDHWLATDMYDRKNQSLEEPTTTLKSITTNVVDKNGNMHLRTVPGNFDVFTGAQFNWTVPGKGQPVETMAKDHFYFGGNSQPIENIKGAKVIKILGATWKPAPGTITKDDYNDDGSFKKSSEWKTRIVNSDGSRNPNMEHNLYEEVVIPKEQVKEMSDNVQVNHINDDGSVSQEPLLNSWHFLPGRDKFSNNSAENGDVQVDTDGNLHMVILAPTPNTGTLQAMGQNVLDKNAFIQKIIEGTTMNEESEEQ